MKLTKKQQNESMMMTWGRIWSLSRILNMLDKDERERFKSLIKKFNEDISRAKIEENYFKYD